MSVTLDASADTPRSDWPALMVPPAAAEQWAALQSEIRDLGGRVPCEVDPEAWFATRLTKAGARAQASAVEACGWCPVLASCRAYALGAGNAERTGVWGGLTPEARGCAR